MAVHLNDDIGPSRLPMSKRTPSILVTDARSTKSRSTAPFAGHAAVTSDTGANYRGPVKPPSASKRITSSIRDKLKYPHNGYNSQDTYKTRASRASGSTANIPNGRERARLRRTSEASRFSGVSMDNILLGSSSMPSGRREQRGSNSSWDRFPVSEKLQAPHYSGKNYRKSINPLPSRTSKISQKLVLIPEDSELTSLSNTDISKFARKGIQLHGSGDILDRQNHSIQRSQLIDDQESYRYQEGKLARLTAYNIADGFNLELLSSFLQETHEVSPRLYDDCLYVPYVLPLLPGKDGFRIKSNVSKKISGGKTLIEKLLDTSEQRDHHFEYYSGVETMGGTNGNRSTYVKQTNELDLDDPKGRKKSVDLALENTGYNLMGQNNTFVNNPNRNREIREVNSSNPSDDNENNNNNNNNSNENSNNKLEDFDPSEPQFFPEESRLEQQVREREELLQMTSPVSTSPVSTADLLKFESKNDNKNPSSSNNNQYSDNLSSTLSQEPPTIEEMAEAETKRLINKNKYRHAELFIFHYGVIVFWNFTEEQEKNLLGDLAFADEKNLMIRPLDEPDIETEEFHFEYDKDTERPRIFNDIITLRSGDHFIKLTLSYAIAQSSKLSRFESRLSPILSSVMKLPKRLALHGTLGLKREQLLKKSGKLFKLRVDVNLSSNVLDTPDFFWSVEPSLHPLYIAMREYLEIDKRVSVVNDRCKVFLEFFDTCVDSVAERNMARVTFWFLIMVVVGVIFSVSEVMVRYIIIHR
ncbi:sporulation protein Rmd8p [Monosporozyma servazzii]